MSKAVLISINPKWCELIASGKKTIEVRKTKPKLETPFKVYIYSTKPKNKNDLGLCLDKGMFGTLKKVGLLYKRNYETANHLNMQILSGKVIGEFICDKIFDLSVVCEVHDELPSRPCEYWLEWDTDCYNIPNEACLSAKEIMTYLGKSDCGYAWHISDLVIYDKPMELREFSLARHCFNYENVEITENSFGNFVKKYYDNAFCRKCRDYDNGLNWCNRIDNQKQLTRPPQSWCYVEGEGSNEQY